MDQTPDESSLLPCYYLLEAEVGVETRNLDFQFTSCRLLVSPPQRVDLGHKGEVVQLSSPSRRGQNSGHSSLQLSGEQKILFSDKL